MEISRRKLVASAAATFALPFISRATAEDKLSIVFNASEALNSDGLAQKALKLVLPRMGKPYQLVPSDVPYPTQAGAVSALKFGNIDLSWYGADTNIAAIADPILYPLDRGLLGYRTFLIHKDMQPKFSAVRTVEQLRPFVALQGQGWGDIKILEAAGIKVRTGLYKNLFQMTVMGRGDFFPRAVNESVSEQEIHKSELPDLAIEQSLCLKYRFAMFFFVSRAKPGLREDMSRALERAFADGSFDEMFHSDKNVKLALGNFGSRRIIEVENPTLPNEVGKIDPKYWITL